MNTLILNLGTIGFILLCLYSVVPVFVVPVFCCACMLLGLYSVVPTFCCACIPLCLYTVLPVYCCACMLLFQYAVVPVYCFAL